MFAAAERMELEGIVSKRRGSRYKSWRVDPWRKTKAWAESNLILVGVDVDKRTGTPMALLAHQDEAGLRYAGGAFFALQGRQREMLRERLGGLATDRAPIVPIRKRGAQWFRPEVVVGVRHLRGEGALRHATAQELRS